MSLEPSYRPWINEDGALNCASIAQMAVDRARREGLLIPRESALLGILAEVIDKAELVRAGYRFSRGEGGTAQVVLGQIGSRADVPEAHMNAAQDVFGASDKATLDKLRAAVRAVRALDTPRERRLSDAVRNFLSGWNRRGVYIDPSDEEESSLITCLRSALGEDNYAKPAWGPNAQPTLLAAE